MYCKLGMFESSKKNDSWIESELNKRESIHVKTKTKESIVKNRNFLNFCNSLVNIFLILHYFFCNPWFSRLSQMKAQESIRKKYLFSYSYKFIISISLAKVSDRSSFWANQNYSDSFRYLYPSQCESFRTNMKKALYLVWWKTVKNRSDLIRFNSRQQSEPIRNQVFNPNPSELGWFQTEFSIRTNLNHSNLGFIRIDIDWKLGFGLFQVVVSDQIRLSRIDFWSSFKFRTENLLIF